MRGLRRTPGTNPQKTHYLADRWIQTETWQHGYSIEKRFLQINISGFTDFRNSGNIHPKRDSCTFMDIVLKIQPDKSSTPQIIKRWKLPTNKHPVPGTSPSAIRRKVSANPLLRRFLPAICATSANAKCWSSAATAPMVDLHATLPRIRNQIYWILFWDEKHITYLCFVARESIGT